MSAELLAIVIPGLWIAAGGWSALMAAQLLTVSAEDRGAVKAMMRGDTAMLTVANKMVRLSYNRLVISLFAILAGIILILDEWSERTGMSDDGFSVGGVVLVVGFLLLVIMQGVISVLDLRDREKLTSVP